MVRFSTLTLAGLAAFGGAQAASWQKISRPGGRTFSEIVAPSLNMAFTHDLRTDNGGDAWSDMTVFSGRWAVYGMEFPSPLRGFVLSQIGLSGTKTLHRTTNGGLGWTSASLSLAGPDLRALAFPTLKDGYILQANGAVSASHDSGATWTSAGSANIAVGPVGVLHFSTASTGFTLDTVGGIHRTTNSGASWTQVHAAAHRVRAIHFPNASTGYAVGDAGLVAKSTDGGASWAAQSSGSSAGLRAVRFMDADTGFAGGGAGTLLKTTNGGATWSPVALGTQATITTLAFPSGSFGYAGTDSAFFFRYGTPSIVPPSDLNYPRASLATYVVGAAIASDTPVVTGTQPAYTVAPSLPQGLVLNNVTGILSGTPEAGVAQGPANYVVTATNSAGSTRDTLRLTFTYAPPTGLRYWYPNVRTWAVGVPIVENVAVVQGVGLKYRVTPPLPPGLSLDTSSGTLRGTPTDTSSLRTYAIVAENPGGTDTTRLQWRVATRTWDSLTLPAFDGTRTLEAIAFVDSLRGHLAASDGVLRTTNGGATWARQTEYSPIYGIHFRNAAEGYMLGANLSQSGSRSFYKTQDSGSTWGGVYHPAPQSGPGIARAAAFPADGVGYFDMASNIVKFIGGGNAWMIVNVPRPPIGFRFTSATTGLALTDKGTVLRTTDGGATWLSSGTELPGTLRGVHFADANAWIAVGTGGRILRTSDAGASWTPVASSAGTKDLYDIKFRDASNGWAVGDSGIILRTRDAGSTWREEFSGKIHLLTRLSIAGNTAYLIGYHNELFRRSANDSAPGPIAIAPSARGGGVSGIMVRDGALRYVLAAPGPVHARLLDLNGREVWSLRLPAQAAGAHAAPLPTLGTGMHVLHFRAAGRSTVLKIRPR